MNSAVHASFLRSSRSSLAALLVATAVSGCIAGARSPADAASAKSTPLAVFPAPNDLAQLPSLPPPANAFQTSAIPVDTWTSAASSQDDGGSYDDPSPWGKLTHSAAQAHASSARLSPALRCAAADLARFYVDKRGLPTAALFRFVVARCGGITATAIPAVYHLEVPDGTSDDSIYEHAKAGVQQIVDEKLSGAGRRVFGLAVSRVGRQVAIGVVVGRDDVRLDPGHLVADASRQVVIRGTLLTGAADVVALINQGDYATQACERDPRERLPAFAFSCQLGEHDPQAWTQILVRREGRLLSEAVADLLVYQADSPPLAYRPHEYGVPSPVADAPRLSAALLASINRVRAEGKLAPLSLAAKQSDDNTRLVGTLIDAMTRGREQDADRISLGLLAGWDVGGTIRDGNLFIGMVAPTHDATAWLDVALEQPLGRLVLLDPEARRIAIGPALAAGSELALAAAVTTYSLFESDGHEKDTALVWKRVLAARRDDGRQGLTRVESTELADAAKAILRNDIEPMAALNQAVQAYAQHTRGRVSGMVGETNDLRNLPIPPQVLGTATGSLAIAVTHHRVDGAAWGQYVILYMLVKDGAAGTGQVALR